MTRDGQHKAMYGRWWIFFPLRGLDVIDEHPNLKKPLFGDATLISKSHVRGVVQQARFNEGMSVEHDYEKDIVFMIENATLIEHVTLGEEYQSLIAVRRSSKLGDDLPESRKTLYAAYSRALQISATLAFIFLSTSESGLTCGLIEQIRYKTQSVAALDVDQKQFMMAISPSGASPVAIRDRKESIKLSVSQLQDILNSEVFGSLASILLPNKSPCARSLRRALSASVSRLSDTIYSPDLGTRLLGAVTAIEILLSESGDSYQDIIRRLTALLGKPVLESFGVREIFEARHLYVHKGEEPKRFSPIGSESIGLALNTIFKYSDLALQFSAKQPILDYLELVDKAYRIQEDLGSPVLTQILRHTPTYQVFPFLQPKPGNTMPVSE